MSGLIYFSILQNVVFTECYHLRKKSIISVIYVRWFEQNLAKEMVQDIDDCVMSRA
jgi:hypothetical protein